MEWLVLTVRRALAAVVVVEWWQYREVKIIEERSSGRKKRQL